MRIGLLSIIAVSLALGSTCLVMAHGQASKVSEMSSGDMSRFWGGGTLGACNGGNPCTLSCTGSPTTGYDAYISGSGTVCSWGLAGCDNGTSTTCTYGTYTDSACTDLLDTMKERKNVCSN